jgi:hypothetical protein
MKRGRWNWMWIAFLGAVQLSETFVLLQAMPNHLDMYGSQASDAYKNSF